MEQNYRDNPVTSLVTYSSGGSKRPPFNPIEDFAFGVLLVAQLNPTRHHLCRFFVSLVRIGASQTDNFGNCARTHTLATCARYIAAARSAFGGVLISANFPHQLPSPVNPARCEAAGPDRSLSATALHTCGKPMGPPRKSYPTTRLSVG